MAMGLNAGGIPTVQPAGGHAVYVDAKAFLPHIPPEQFPGRPWCASCFWRGNPLVRDRLRHVREAGRRPFRPAAMELVRLAFPRRVYTQSHFDYILEGMESLAERKAEISGCE